MVTVNHNYLRLPGSYLFSTIGKKVNAYAAADGKMQADAHISWHILL